MAEGRMEKQDVDGGWAWVVLTVTVLILTLQASFSVSVGLFLVEFLESFSGSKGLVALIGGLAISGQTLLGPVAGILSNLLTHRIVIMIGAALMTLGLVLASFSPDLVVLLLTFGITCGTGTGLAYSPSVTITSNYFCKYRTIANGITLGSPGVGVLAAPYLLRWLIESYGWRSALVVYGCIMAQMCVLASFLFPHDMSSTPSCCACRSNAKGRPTDDDIDAEAEKVPMSAVHDRVKDLRNAEIMVGSRTAMHVSEFGSVLLSNSVVWTVEEVKSGTLRRLKQLLGQRFMWVLCLNQMLLMAGLSINSVLFPSYASSVGIPFDDLPAIYTVFGVTMMVCRVAAGFIFSLIPQHMLRVFFCLQVALALILALLPFYGLTLDALFVFKFLVGSTYGPTFMLVTPILIHYVGLEDLSVAFGVVMLCCGFGYAVAPPLGGLMYDFFGNYRVSYYIAGATVGTGALSLLLLFLIKDLQPLIDTDLQQGSLMAPAEKESDNNDDDDQPDMKTVVGVEKPGMNGVHIIDDMEELRLFVDDRHA